MIERICLETNEPCQYDCGAGECVRQLINKRRLYDHFRAQGVQALGKCADALGINRKHLGRVAKGKATASEDLARRIAEHAGVPVEWIHQLPKERRRTTNKTGRADTQPISQPSNKLIQLPWR